MPTKDDEELRRIIAECREEARLAGAVAVRTAHRQDRTERRLRDLRRQMRAALRDLRDHIDRLVGARTDRRGNPG